MVTEVLIRDRIRGCLLGHAIGDALGAPVEECSHEQLREWFPEGLRDYILGPRGEAIPSYQPGQVTDDTLLALSLAESLIETRGRLNLHNLALRWARLFHDREFQTSGPGRGCLRGMMALAQGVPPTASSPPESAGNGSAMRVHPVGCLPLDPPRIIEAASDQSRPTHADPRAQAGAAVIAIAVHLLIQGIPLSTPAERGTFLTQLEGVAALSPGFYNAWVECFGEYGKIEPEAVLTRCLDIGGHVNETVPAAVALFLTRADEVEEAIVGAVMAGGDTDTVAALVGGLVGARHGEAALPGRWLRELVGRERIETAADDLARLWED